MRSVFSVSSTCSCVRPLVTDALGSIWNPSCEVGRLPSIIWECVAELRCGSLG